QAINKKENPNKIYGVVPYLAPEVLSGKPYTKESDIYSFGMIMWEHTKSTKQFYNMPHDHHLIADIRNGMRPKITKDTPESYANLMKRCWDSNPKNRPTIEEICNSITSYKENRAFELVSPELKRQE